MMDLTVFLVGLLSIFSLSFSQGMLNYKILILELTLKDLKKNDTMNYTNPF